MVEPLLVLVIGMSLMGVAVFFWSSQRFLDLIYRSYQPEISRGPFRQRTRIEARNGIRIAAVLIGLFATFLVVMLVVSLM